MPQKRHAAEEMVANLHYADVLPGQARYEDGENAS